MRCVGYWNSWVNGKQRLFFAFEPAQGVRDQLADIVQSVCPESSRIIPAVNLHMTLVFLGSISSGHLSLLQDIASEIRIHPFEIELVNVHYWRRPRVLVLSPAQVPDELGRLHNDLAGSLGYHGFELETRPYRPHVTLARKVSRQAETPGLTQPLQWSVDSFCLMESVSTPRGVRYEAIDEWR